MTQRIKLCLYGEEDVGWAIDSGRRMMVQTLEALGDVVELCPLAEADVVYALWEVLLLDRPIEDLHGKRVICNITNNLYRLFEQPCMIREDERIGCWVAQSEAAARILGDLGKPMLRFCYCVDPTLFTAQPPDGLTREALCERFDIPPNRIVIGNFMRDTLGSDLSRPKEQKATELLLELLVACFEAGHPIHVLLAGPRRHWIRERLRDRGVPFTFVGEETTHDDMPLNVLDAATMNLLYHASDLHLISSRWEGGPRPALESAATQTPILCTRVGAALDILDETCFFDSFEDGLAKLLAFCERPGDLAQTCASHLARIREFHTPSAAIGPMRKLLSELDRVPPVQARHAPAAPAKASPGALGRLADRARRALVAHRPGFGLTFSLCHEFHRPPWGGGNQFMNALRKDLNRLGARVHTNRVPGPSAVAICNSANFNTDRLTKMLDKHQPKLIHRVDGPVVFYRDTSFETDHKIHAFNLQYADATVYQTPYCMQKHHEIGYDAVRPVILINGVDNAIFNQDGRTPRRTGAKIRLITSAWSPNRLKGGPLLKWLDRHLDWDRFEYTFVGRTHETFENIRHVPAVSSRRLAALLRQHDIFISASMNEPCSNALLEAMACGCPALYRDTGGNATLVGFAGLAFTDESDILGQLDRMSGRVGVYQRLIYVRTFREVTMQYIDLARRLLEEST